MASGRGKYAQRSTSTLWVLLTLLAVGAAGCQNATPPATPTPEVLVAPVVQRDVPLYREWVGTIVGYVNAEIRPKVQGYLLSQHYQNGSVVKEGQLLFQIDPRQFQAALDQAKGALLSAQAILKKTELDVARYKPLAAQGAVSQQELDDAIQQNEANKAAVFQAQANLEQARLNLEWTRVTSPIDGIAGINQAQIGDLVGPNDVLTVVSTVDPIKVQFPISEQEYLSVAQRINRTSESGHPNPDAPTIQLILADGSTYAHEGRFYAVNRQVDERTGTLLVQALFPNPDNILRPGGYAKARAATDVEKNALVIPQRAVVDVQGTFKVYVVKDNKVEVRDVVPGPRTGSDWVITKGLEAGEQVVVEGVQKIRDGITVVAKAAPPQDAPGIYPTPTPASDAAQARSAS